MQSVGPLGWCQDCVRVLDVGTHSDQRGSLTSVETGAVGFDVARVFVVAGRPDTVRGGHAHLKGRQVLVLASGRVVVDLVAHGERWQVTLPDDARAVLLEPRVWSQQHYVGSGSCLAVLCDTAYDPLDYVTEPPLLSGHE